MVNLELLIKARDEASGVFSKVNKEAGGLGKALGNLGKFGGLAAAAGIGAATFAAVDFIKAAAEEEAGVKRLQAAVEASGKSWKDVGKGVEDVIAQREKLAFSDDDLRSSLTILTAITGDHEEALRRQAIAMDFARGANIDLGTASKLLGKVTDETVNVLGRYGIRVKEGADATDVLALVQQKFAGQSKAYAESTAGKWERFNIQMQDIKETIGAALLPVVSSLADTLATFLEEHQADIERIVKAWSTFAQSEIFPRIKDAVQALADVMTPFIKWIADNQTRTQAALIGMGATAVAIFTAWAISAGVAAAATLAAVAPVLGVAAAIGVLSAAAYLLVTNFDEVKKFLAGHWKEILGIALTILTGPGGLVFLFASNSFGIRDTVIGAFGEILKFFEGLPARFQAAAAAIARAIGDGFKGAWNVLAAQINSAIPNDIGFDIPKVNLGPLGSIGGGHVNLNLPDNPIPQLAAGGRVMQTGLAVVHEGETYSGVGRGLGGELHVHFHSTFATASPDEMNRAAIQLKALLRGAL